MLNIRKNISLAKYTTFHIGGSAKFFTEVNSESELVEALDFAKENNLEFFILGGGSNLLISDNGFNGLVIKMEIINFQPRITDHGEIIEIGAGVLLARVVNDSAESNLTGMEWAVGIPGTVGGAIRGNAGAFGREMKDVICQVKVLKILNHKMRNLTKLQNANPDFRSDKYFESAVYKLEDCGFKYRDSIFKQDKNLIILSASIELGKGDRNEIAKKMKEILERRISKQPVGFSAGSFFTNPFVGNGKIMEEFEKESGIRGKEGRVPAGWLIEKAGLVGKKIGGVMISEMHSNYILNTGAARAEDVIMLASFIKQQVRDKFGVQLREEVQYFGF